MSLTLRKNIHRPKWIWLYGLVPMGLLLFWLADLITQPNSWRILAECGAVMVACALALAWVRANRIALTQVDPCPVPDKEKLMRFHRAPQRLLSRTVAGQNARLRVVR